jgi:signal transduction histidine kinase
MHRYRSSAIWGRLAFASLGTAAAIGIVCAVGLSSLEHTSAVAREAVSQQLALIDDAAAMSAFQYQKGFVAEYLLTGNRLWLSELETNRSPFESWLASAHTKVTSRELAGVLDAIQREYGAYDSIRKQAVSRHDEGRVEEAKTVLQGNYVRTQRLWRLFQEFAGIARREAERALADAQRNVARLGRILVGTSMVGAAASLLVGFWWARRATRPIYELEVQIESAAERTRIQVAPGRAGLEALGDQVRALVEKLEETDTALGEHRRRLVQSEKLSAMGELAAKLAHEVLNPLAGMKAAIQLLARQGAATPGGAPVVETAEALNREIARVEGLVRRLVNYSRPLAPRVEIVTVSGLMDSAEEATRSAFQRSGIRLVRTEAPVLPPVEVDPLLFTQAMVNLLINAIEASGADGAQVELSAIHPTGGHDEVVLRVADHGPGLEEAHLPELFKPFFTTKPDGHGLGLAVTQNIVLEHGGRIEARNRPPEQGSGAVFEIHLPVVR